MIHQETFELHTGGRGTSNITDRVTAIVAKGPAGPGLAHVFVRHTSCSLLITENADPDVRRDLEGDDDMAAHARSALTGTSLTVPVNNRRLLLGTWQGIYLWEHRTQGHVREVVVTVMG